MLFFLLFTARLWSLLPRAVIDTKSLADSEMESHIFIGN